MESNTAPQQPPKSSSGLALADPTAESLEQLRRQIAELQAENKSLRINHPNEVTASPPSDILVMFDVQRHGEASLVYLEEPSWTIGRNEDIGFRANNPIADHVDYVRERPNIAISVMRYYDLAFQWDEVKSAIRRRQPLPRPVPRYESLVVHSPAMKESVQEFFARQPTLSIDFPDFDHKSSVQAPYVPYWYYTRSPDALEALEEEHRKNLAPLFGWLNEHYGDMYKRVADQHQRGVVSAETFPFLFKAGDALVSMDGGTVKAFIADSWPERPKVSHPSGKSTTHSSEPKKRLTTWTWAVTMWRYEYDGKLYKDRTTEEITLTALDLRTEVRIDELRFFPAQYAQKETRELLASRGKTFWDCRKRRLVAYQNKDTGHIGGNDRFMIDFDTYRQLHLDRPSLQRLNPEDEREYLSQQRMDDDSPPPEPEIFAFPETIVAYNLHKKKWVDLDVDRIRSVVWNKQAFANLVIDESTKQLVQALVTNQIAQEQGTDLIDSKGHGLILLLHGSPGTGKTYTAESVAEMAEKPLFRVTCGDIGTKPEAVEKYLESALHLGKSWGCVVLLDEADVFLEQRTLTDLDRNALVSVFLRVLEYYDGILILTSNRVGTFDEAFRSRIQLSLYYKNLEKPQRQKIWKNFLNRLKEMDKEYHADLAAGDASKQRFKEPTGIDFDDVECYIEELAKVPMNGREIRNAITTARQLAKFLGKKMTYEDLKRVIAVSSEFDNYLKTVQDGFSNDELARSGGIR